MGYYSTLTRCDDVNTLLSVEEFTKRWHEAVQATVGTNEESYLFYRWEVARDEGSTRWFSIQTEDWHTKHYADGKLAEFISGVIAPGARCILEFSGEDGFRWGYYVTEKSVKEIEYVKLVDGRRID